MNHEQRRNTVILQHKNTSDSSKKIKRAHIVLKQFPSEQDHSETKQYEY